MQPNVLPLSAAPMVYDTKRRNKFSRLSVFDGVESPGRSSAGKAAPGKGLEAGRAGKGVFLGLARREERPALTGAGGAGAGC